ncbi:MAG: hypothetical protein OFPI_32590 [Osedax symbiont Rs2]|nr:MAG: hypothetical protein OFPI_32590 [Osedax symbiont Rs2]
MAQLLIAAKKQKTTIGINSSSGFFMIKIQDSVFVLAQHSITTGSISLSFSSNQTFYKPCKSSSPFYPKQQNSD